MLHPNPLRPKLAAGKTVVGLWVTLEAPTLTEIAVAMGMDWVCIDAEHGHLDYKEIVEHIRATRGSQTAPLVRISDIHQGLIKRMLDLGAMGILAPQVTGPEDVAKAVQFAKYPPVGIRGVGAERSTAWGSQLSSTRLANNETLVIPLLETAAAGVHLDGILATPGIDAVFFGPADYSASMGHLGDWEGPGVAERLLDFRRRITAFGLPCGIMSTGPDDLLVRKAQGFSMLGLGSDTGLVIRGLTASLNTLGRKPGQQTA